MLSNGQFLPGCGYIILQFIWSTCLMFADHLKGFPITFRAKAIKTGCSFRPSRFEGSFGHNKYIFIYRRGQHGSGFCQATCWLQVFITQFEQFLRLYTKGMSQQNQKLILSFFQMSH